MFDLIFLGTAASVPSATRGVSSLLVLHDRHRFLVDCGEGTQRQLIKSGFGFRRLDRILLTHGHLDHVLGLGGLMATFSEWEPMQRVTLYGGASALAVAHDLIDAVILPRAGEHLDLDFVDLTPGPVIEDTGFRLSAVPLRHADEDAYGFVFEEKPRHHFREGAAETLGVPKGPARHRLAHGETIMRADGTTVAPDDVLGPALQGTKLVVLDDMDATENLAGPLSGADALVIEATYLDTDRNIARSHGHITAGDAARLAADAGVKALYLNHISDRHGEDELLAEARAHFPTARIAHDFDQVKVIRERAE